MKLKTAVILVCLICLFLFVAVHYNDHISITFPSPAEVVAAISKTANEVNKSSEASIRITFSGKQESADSPDTEEIYRVSTAWNDHEDQLGAYCQLENAVCNCPVGYYVFNSAGEIIYDPNCDLFPATFG